MRNTLHAQEELEAMRINEAEEYLGLLRAKMAITQVQVAEADEQIGIVRELLNSDGIPEVSLSDDEDDDLNSRPESYHPSSSGVMKFPESSVSDTESECGPVEVSTSPNEDRRTSSQIPSELSHQQVAPFPPTKKHKKRQRGEGEDGI